jgi:hypothetical protein
MGDESVYRTQRFSLKGPLPRRHGEDSSHTSSIYIVYQFRQVDGNGLISYGYNQYRDSMENSWRVWGDIRRPMAERHREGKLEKREVYVACCLSG